ncbi:head maturation protease, ClpP-related [Clostridium cylindrosporum]|uniref:ATP-dependent Clp protease proteolytic subunit n=1 Tax=Clostridium cylindrosporum DSM 605 TaxID=1121307 RepID=A0A0J8DAF5_CLOCY|nr:head maturation protease, ClpP-related [Clostridium cylindrosporum]KMT23000.1 protease subunit of ATP-dependent Clp protease [Clostridium cylindrosporum DSM 605]
MLYGPISETSWWGDEVTPKQFSDDLKALGEVSEIDVRINSSGGDVFAAQAINALLRSHRATINVFIDGLAASAATIIAMAGDKIYIPSSAMMMIHNPLVTLWGMYNKQDFESMTEVLDKVKDSIINAYAVKTGKDKQELSDIMDNETWFTGAEAVEQGFADELTDSDTEAFMNGSFMVVNNVKFDVSKFKNTPRVSNKINNSINQVPQITNKKQGDGNMTLDKLKNEYPELFNQVLNQGREEGIKAERDRIQAIEDISVPGFEDMVQDAKFNNTITAETLAMNIVKANKNIGTNYMNSVKEDAAGIDNIEGDGAPTNKATEEEKIYDVANKMANSVNKVRGGAR